MNKEPTRSASETPLPADEHNVHGHAGGVHGRTGWILGLCGLLPFLLLTALIAYGGKQTIAFATVVLVYAAYSATILAFLGGIRWGHAIGKTDTIRHDVILSVLPAIAGWILVLVPAPYVFAGFAAAFALQGFWDVISARRGRLPDWFARVRIVLSVVVVLCQIVTFVSTY